MTANQKENLPTVALFMNGRLRPMRVVPEKRQDVIFERKYSFETPPPSIPNSEIAERITAEVAVVGGGISGMSAALSAAEAGGRVVLIEKRHLLD
jgi:NADPH-dependent 2,4-dienoyl-CoA reductase/sulfur reductase-like enzyme